MYETIRQDIAKDKVRRQQLENAMDIPVTDTPSAGASVTGIDVDTILTGESSDEWSIANVPAARSDSKSTTTRRQQQSVETAEEWSDSSDKNHSKMSINKLSNSASTRTHSAAVTTAVTMTHASARKQQPSPVDGDDIDIFNPFAVDKNISDDD